MAKFNKLGITRTKLFREVKKDLSKAQLKIWVDMATNQNQVFNLIHSKELDREGHFVIQVGIQDEEFWMEAHRTKEEAIKTCEKMGWKFIDRT